MRMPEARARDTRQRDSVLDLTKASRCRLTRFVGDGDIIVVMVHGVPRIAFRARWVEIDDKLRMELSAEDRAECLMLGAGGLEVFPGLRISAKARRTLLFECADSVRIHHTRPGATA